MSGTENIIKNTGKVNHFVIVLLMFLYLSQNIFVNGYYYDNSHDQLHE